MKRSIVLTVVLVAAMCVENSFGFWVRRPSSANNQRQSVEFGYFGPETDSNYGVWVELPQINISVAPAMGSQALNNQTQAPAAQSTTPEQQNQEITKQTFNQISDVNSDIEYEVRLFKAKSNTPNKDSTLIADVIKVSGRYEYFPDDAKSYGFRFYNEHVDGFDYMNSFNAAGMYKKYWSDMEAGCTFNVNFESGMEGGLIFGPTLHFLYKHYFGASKLSAGAFGGYSYSTMKKFGGWHHSFLTYGIIGAYSIPLSEKVAGCIDAYASHDFFAGGIQIPYYLSKSVQLIGGFKKVFVFQEWNLSNYIITIGASRRF